MAQYFGWVIVAALILDGFPALGQQSNLPTISTAPGTLVRWSAPGTTRCSMKARSWAAVRDACYYPVDLEQAAATVIPITRSGGGHTVAGRIRVEAFDYGVEEITLPDIPQANPSAADFRRDARERVLLGKVWNRREGPPRFTLPLAAPVQPLPKGKSFGVKRVFNGKPAPQRHTGTDYATPVGSPVLAVADGTVVIAQDLVFEGNAVFIDHGDGLITMYFHLADIKVEPGQEVKKGHQLGRVGSTGRATRPHLFFGVRWHNARIDPQFVLEDPGKIPAVTQNPAAK
jgi:murein DD-endopeptidase MepM/ murein hydrolase activator NlpD